MKKITLLFASLFALNFVALAQSNLVPNSSFETYTTCPDFSGQLNYVNDWNNVNLVYGNFSYGSPDYYHTCGAGSLASLPSNNYGTLNAFHGNAVVGLVIYNYDITDYREYMSAQLTQPLNPEITYTIRFRLTGGTNQGYRFHSSDFGIVFSENPLTQNTWNIINETAQVQLDTMLNTSNWVTYTFNYTPDKTYNYLTLGSFKHDADVNPIDIAPSVNKYSNVYIDAIEIFNSNTSLKKNDISSIKVQYVDGNLLIANPENEMINSLTIYDIQGKIIQSATINSRKINSFDLSAGYTAGIYSVSLVTDNSTTTQKIVVSK